MKKNTNMKNEKKLSKSPIFLIALLNFIIITLIIIYIIYLRFIPYKTITYDGYAVSGKDIVNNLLNTTFDVKTNIDALEVKDQDDIYQNMKSYYLGADKKNDINLDYPIYVNDTLALYNLSSNVILYTDDLKMIEGYPESTLTAGALYNSNTLERADYYDYILMKNEDGMYINTQEITIQTTSNKYKIKMNSIINFNEDFITYYTLEDGKFIYSNILDIDMNSIITIKEYKKKYSYEEFLVGLGKIRENKPVEENVIEENVAEEENTVEEDNIIQENEVKEENIIVNEILQEDIGQNEVTEPEVEKPTDSDDNKNKWKKPTVSSTDFIPNVYTAETEVSISDPNKAIDKGIIFTFYIDDEIVFRASTLRAGNFKVAKLLPNTKYKVIGSYKYKNQDGNMIDVKFLDQEFKTLDLKNIKPIELEFKKGEIYSDKIEITDFKISSDINDEAISGVSRAEVEINGKIYSIGTGKLREILRGDTVKHEFIDGITSNTKYKYEFKFYDTADNEMKLKNNTGSTETSKMIPDVTVKLKKQDVISVELEVLLNNEDDVKLNNYRYVIYSDKGEFYKKGDLTAETKSLYFDDLNADHTYNIKVYADFDIDDGRGVVENQEIGDATFTTVPLKMLGSLKLDVNYKDDDIKHNEITLDTIINSKTDLRLIKILKQVNIIIKDNNGVIVNDFEITDINSLNIDGIKTKITSLESNTEYSIIITAIAQQGDIEQKIETSYTLNTFVTRKKSAEAEIKKFVITTSVIDFDFMVYDKDGASLDGKYVMELRNKRDDLVSYKEFKANEYIRCAYDKLNKGEEYTITCYAKEYNETNDNKNLLKGYKIFYEKHITTGLEGNIELTGLIRESESSKNLIDVQSNNNWHSKCFDVMTTEYVGTGSEAEFKIESTRDYGKTYNPETKELTLTSNQCYVYNLESFKEKNVTISFEIKGNSNLDKIFIQNGKDVEKGNLKSLNDEDVIKNNNRYQYTTKLKDGYIGFYLEKANKAYTITIKELQVEKGEDATEYVEYTLNQALANIQTDFTDEKYLTMNGEISNEKYCRYYIRFLYNDVVEEKSNTIPSTKIEKDKSSHKIEKHATYKVQLLIKVYDREYILDEISFEYNDTSSIEIKGIRSKEDFRNIQPDGNYILLTDLDLTEAEKVSENTFGNPNIAFSGTIDFNGKTIKRDTYSSKNKKQSTSYMFYKLDEHANLKNIVMNVHIDNIHERWYIPNSNEIQINELDGIYPLFLYNDGNIDNIMINLKECSKLDQQYVSLIGYNNENNGIIQNFIINLMEDRLYGTQSISGVALNSSGKIQNGYMYGKGIEAIEDIPQMSSRNMAGIVYNLSSGAILQNVYNLTEITINHINKTNSFAANIAYQVNSGAKVRNVYSIKEYKTIYNREYKKLLNETNKEIDDGPNILHNNGDVQFSYYFCETNYLNNVANLKQDMIVLNDNYYQDNLLNANGCSAFLVEGYAENGYYPHLRLNRCMPPQELIKIDMNDDSETIDILSSEVIKIEELENKVEYDEELDSEGNKEYKEEVLGKLKAIKESDEYRNENAKIVIFNVYNPRGIDITNINMKFIGKTEIIYQKYADGISAVYVVLSEPSTYINEYNVISILGKNFSGTESVKRYEEKNGAGTRTVKVSFIKNILSAEDWDNIDQNDSNEVSGLIQNYKLINDIDFADSDYEPSIVGTFTGYIDGNNKKLKNITTNKGIFGDFNAKIENLFVENITINSSMGNIGLIERVTNDSFIDNVHIVNMTLSSTQNSGTRYVGGLIGNIYDTNVSIQNSTIKVLKIDLQKEERYTDWNVGGMIGSINGARGEFSNVNITNCYVKSMDINTRGARGSIVGGIVGYVVNNNIGRHFNITNCFTTGTINTDMSMVGGIYGRILAGNIETIKNCYSMVNIINELADTSVSECVGGIGGHTVYTSRSEINNNLYLGDIYINKDVIYSTRRIVGNLNRTTDNNYGFKEQLINGKESSDLLGARELLSYEDLFKEDTYKEKLKFDGNYDYSKLNKGILPRLKDTRGNLLPGQDDDEEGNKLIRNDLKFISNIDRYIDIGTKKGVEVIIKLENPYGATINDVEIENRDLTIIEKNISNSVENDINYTTITLKAIPERYYDIYRINKILYTTGENNQKELETNIEVKRSFYKTINSAQEWNDKTSVEYAENYKVTGNIDFSTVEEIKTNVLIGRLEADSTKTISMSDDKVLIFNAEKSGLIKSITTQIENINFENIRIEANAHDIGIIWKSNAEMKKCNFSNIEIKGIQGTKSYNYIGIISRLDKGSSIDTVKLDHVKVSGNSRVAGLAAYRNSSGNVENVIGTYLNIEAKGSMAGGLFGRVEGGGTLRNIRAYQYSAKGLMSGDSETDYLVKGMKYTGGCIGSLIAIGSDLETTNSKIIGVGSTGGVIGHCSSYSGNNIISSNNTIESTGERVGGAVGENGVPIIDCQSFNNTIKTSVNYVGGVFGSCNLWESTSGRVLNIESDNNTIEGKECVGGIAGYLSSSKKNSDYTYASNIRSTNNSVNGTYYVGGCFGDAEARLINVMSTDANIIGENYVGGIVGIHTFSKIGVGENCYSVNGAYVRNSYIRGTNYVGGYSGDQNGTIYAAAVDNTTVNATESNAGGIAGRYQWFDNDNTKDYGEDKESSEAKITNQDYYIKHSFCTNSIVNSSNNAGGLVGEFIFGNMQYCYVGNTEVSVLQNNAGGLIGLFRNDNMTTKQYISTIKYNYVVNTDKGGVTGESDVGGLIGRIYDDILVYEEVGTSNKSYYIESNLIATDITSMYNYASMGVGFNGGGENNEGIYQIKNMNNIYVYDSSVITTDFNGTQQVKEYLGKNELYKDITEDNLENCYILLSGDYLSNNTIYTDTNKLNFGNERFDYENGYFPRLKKLDETYWGEGNLNVDQVKIEVPNTTGIVLSEPISFSLKARMMEPIELPNVYSYAVDVDKINIEFSQTNPYSYFDVRTADGEVIVESQKINERVYTLQYDFKTELVVTVSNMNNWYKETINKQTTNNVLDVKGDEYLYILDNKLYSNKRSFDGEYINLYNGKVLSNSGDIYDILTMRIIDKSGDEIKILDEQTPISSVEYEGMKVDTFYHCSKVIYDENNYMYKDQQIFIKNEAMYLVDGDLDSKGNSIIIDSYNDKQYQTILGIDGRMYDLLTEIKYPANFDNENIITTTNNVNNNNDIILVYYSTGRVYGFNYITGQEVYDNNIGKSEMNLLSYIADSFDFGNVLYEMNKSNYIEAQKLTEKLEQTPIQMALKDVAEDNESEQNIIENTLQDNINENDSIYNNISSSGNNTTQLNKYGSEKYVTTYNAKTKKYDVYSVSEILTGETEKTVSENEKINKNEKLTSYYANLSTGKIELKDVGIFVFAITVLMICGGLVIMYTRNYKKNR